jgi:hypothetical protein
MPASKADVKVAAKQRERRRVIGSESPVIEIRLKRGARHHNPEQAALHQTGHAINPLYEMLYKYGLRPSVSRAICSMKRRATDDSKNRKNGLNALIVDRAAV